MSGTPTTEKAPDKTTEKTEAPRKEAFTDLVRKVALASVGGVVLLQEEIEEFVSKLVQKGELAEKDGKVLVKDLMEKRKQKDAPNGNGTAATDEAHRFALPASFTKTIDSTVDRVLHRINIPTKADVEELSKKIDEIDKKLETLAAARRSA